MTDFLRSGQAFACSVCGAQWTCGSGQEALSNGDQATLVEKDVLNQNPGCKRPNTPRCQMIKQVLVNPPSPLRVNGEMPLSAECVLSTGMGGILRPTGVESLICSGAVAAPAEPASPAEGPLPPVQVELILCAFVDGRHGDWLREPGTYVEFGRALPGTGTGNGGMPLPAAENLSFDAEFRTDERGFGELVWPPGGIPNARLAIRLVMEVHEEGSFTLTKHEVRCGEAHRRIAHLAKGTPIVLVEVPVPAWGFQGSSGHGAKAAKVGLHATGEYPFSSLAPSIDLALQVACKPLSAEGGAPLQFEIEHDGFASCELYVNGTNIRLFDAFSATPGRPCIRATAGLHKQVEVLAGKEECRVLSFHEREAAVTVISAQPKASCNRQMMEETYVFLHKKTREMRPVVFLGGWDDVCSGGVPMGTLDTVRWPNMPLVTHAAAKNFLTEWHFIKSWMGGVSPGLITHSWGNVIFHHAMELYRANDFSRNLLSEFAIRLGVGSPQLPETISPREYFIVGTNDAFRVDPVTLPSFFDNLKKTAGVMLFPTFYQGAAIHPDLQVRIIPNADLIAHAMGSYASNIEHQEFGDWKLVRRDEVRVLNPPPPVQRDGRCFSTSP